MLEAIITSNAAREIFGLLFSRPEGRFYLRQIGRLTGLPVNGVRRELAKLEKAGFVLTKEEGNVKYFWLNKKNPIYDELKSIIYKTQLIGDKLKKLSGLSGVQVAFIYGSVVRGDERADSDVDLLVVGGVDSLKLHAEISKIESRMNRNVNYVLLSEKEWRYKKTAFIKRVLNDKKIFVVGDEDELRKLA